MRLHYKRKRWGVKVAPFVISKKSWHILSHIWSGYSSEISSISLIPELHSALLPFIPGDGECAIARTMSSFQFSEKTLTCEGSLACRHSQHCIIPHRIVVMKSLSDDRNLSRVGKQLNRTSSFEYQNSCFLFWGYSFVMSEEDSKSLCL